MLNRTRSLLGPLYLRAIVSSRFGPCPLKIVSPTKKDFKTLVCTPIYGKTKWDTLYMKEQK